MSWRTSLTITSISFLIGIFCGSLIWNHPEIQQSKEEATKKDSQIEVVVHKKTDRKPDGSEHSDELSKYFISIEEIEKRSESLNIAQKKRYSVSLFGVDSVKKIAADARIGDLPLFLGVQYDFRSPKDSALSIRLEF